MSKLLHLDLFSGIGGFSLALDNVYGKENVKHIFCDNEPFAQAILKKHWPESKSYSDIRTLTANAEIERMERTSGEKSSNAEYPRRIDLLTGGFPCQPFSQAGRRKGTADDRWLWPEMLRVIREFRPEWIIAENVAGFLTMVQHESFPEMDNEGRAIGEVGDTHHRMGRFVANETLESLEAEGYTVEAFVIPAVAVNAPHRRDRVWIVANRRSTESRRLSGSERKTISKTRETDNNAPDTNDTGDRTPRSDTDTERCGEDVKNPISERLEGSISKQEEKRKRGRPAQPNWTENWPEVAARLCTLDDGLPNGSPRPKGWRNAALKGAGNAIVPQVAEEIMRAIREQMI